MRACLPVLAMLVACGREGSPVRVTVLYAGGIEQETDWRLVRGMADALTEIGFDAMGDTVVLEGEDLPAEARAAMGRSGASNAIVLSPHAEAVRDGLIEGTKLWEVTLDAQVVNELPSHPVETMSLTWSMEQHSAGLVERRVLGTWVPAVSSWAVDKIYLTPSMDKALSDDVEMKDLEAANELQKMKRLVGDRRERVTAFEQFCRDEADILEGFVKSEGVRCYGNPCGQTTVLAVGLGDRAIVQDTSRAPLFTVPLARKASWLEPPERIYAIDLATGAETPLVSSSNFYGMGNALTGAGHGAVETFSSEGNSGIYGFSFADGSRSVLGMLAPREASRFSRVSPDGKYAMACLKGAGCWVDEGGGRIPVESYSSAEFVTLPSGVRLFGKLPSGAWHLEDPANPGGRSVSERGSIHRLLGVVGEELWATVYQGTECELVQLSVDPLKVKARHPMPACLDGIAASPDGRLIGTAMATKPGDVPGDPEVILWTPGEPEFVTVTSGPFREEFPKPSVDGKKIVFNRRLDAMPKDFDMGQYRRVVCVVDTP